MRSTVLSVGFFFSTLFTVFLLLLPVTNTYAKAGCCSSHKGVAGCNNVTGFLSCKDGTTSPTCACDGSTTPKTKASKAQPAEVAAAPVAAEPAAAPAPSSAKKSKMTGCCSGHGGVSKCNKAAGFQMCKDGTQSATCACGS